MCVIIDRAPGIDIPFYKIESACHVNPHGWGISVLDRGKLVTERGYDSKGNDAEAIYKKMEEAKGLPLFLHLRYCTVGDKSVENTHPFQVLNKKDHGIDVMMMHNGTFSGLRNNASTDSDTAIFAKLIAAPLLESFVAMHGPEGAFTHPTVERILKEFSGTTSKLLLYSNEENIKLIVNRKEGKDFEGWWASNDYSFNRSHRESTSYYGGGYRHGQGQTWDSTLNKWVDQKDQSKNAASVGGKNVVASGADSKTSTGTSAVSSSVNKGSCDVNPTNTKSTTGSLASGGAAAADLFTTDVKQEGKDLGKNLKSMRVTGGNPRANRRDTFCELTGVPSLTHVSGMDLEDIQEMVVNFPALTAYLVADLFLALYHQNVADVKAGSVPSHSRSIESPFNADNTALVH